MVQGQQEVHLYPKQKIELFKIGCIDKNGSEDPSDAKVIVKLPVFKHKVIWSLSDASCAKMLGYQPQLQDNGSKSEPDLERLH